MARRAVTFGAMAHMEQGATPDATSLLERKFMTKTKLALLFVVLACTGAFAQSAATVDSFYTPSLGKFKRYTLILPAKYDKSIHYPILYLLHGHSGDHSDWIKRTKIANYVKDLPLIVVMPDGENSWYVNSVVDPAHRFEDYIITDLLQHLQQRYSIDTLRQAIAGLSMGGNGSAVLALRHPGRFRFVGSLSGAITIPRAMDDTSKRAGRYLGPTMRKAYGDRPGQFRRDHDVFQLSRQPRRDTLVYFYFVAGIQDEFNDFLPAHRELMEILGTNKYAYEYHEMPGRHNWQFWDREIQPILKRMKEVMKF
jgi:S-formylglutathione hydrolase FrmB